MPSWKEPSQECYPNERLHPKLPAKDFQHHRIARVAAHLVVNRLRVMQLLVPGVGVELRLAKSPRPSLPHIRSPTPTTRLKVWRTNAPWRLSSKKHRLTSRPVVGRKGPIPLGQIAQITMQNAPPTRQVFCVEVQQRMAHRLARSCRGAT